MIVILITSLILIALVFKFWQLILVLFLFLILKDIFTKSKNHFFKNKTTRDHNNSGVIDIEATELNSKQTDEESFVFKEV
jgi:hypothetical protein